MKTGTIKVDYLARVEGEGGVVIGIRNGKVADVKLKIFEPPRFFEAFLRGRSYREVPDITARICGICPVAYQMSSCQALEDAFGIAVDGPLRDLRRLIYCGEWMESHTLHVVLLHAPDFLGYEDGLQMAREHPEIFRQALQLKKTGNALIALLGGREIHPVNVRVGGFYRVPSRKELARITDDLQRARDFALRLVEWVGQFPFPDFERDYEFVSLRHFREYPLIDGRIVSSQGLDIAVADYDQQFIEEQVPYSTALHSRLKSRGSYLVGPMARYNLNSDKLSATAQQAARQAGLGPVCRNPFRSIIIRSLEVLHACEEALRLVASYEMPEQPAIPFSPRAGTGSGCTEAPRGSLYHRYRVDDNGDVLEARIVPPTSQNQKCIERDLFEIVSPRVGQSEKELQWICEQAIRNYDPCISCSTHCLRLRRDDLA